MPKVCRSCGCESTGCGIVWVVDSYGCNNLDLAAATLTLKQGATVLETATPGFALAALSRTAGGTGYTDGTYALVFSGGGGTGAAGTGTISSGSLISATLTDAGTGYTSAPTATLPGSAGPGTGAAITVSTRSARVTFAPPAAGTYSVVWTEPTGRFASQTATRTVACNTSYSDNMGGTPASGYVCLPQRPTCVYPLAKTIYLSTDDGTVTLIYAQSGSITNWQGYIDHTDTGGGGPDPPDPFYNGPCVVQTVTAPLLYTVDFGVGSVTATKNWPICCTGHTPPDGTCDDSFGAGSVFGSRPQLATLNSGYTGNCVPCQEGGSAGTFGWTCPPGSAAATGDLTFGGPGGGTFPWTE